VTYTLYGNTTLANGVGVGAFIGGVDTDAPFVNDIAYGIGASYDIGGATIAGTIQSNNFSDGMYADLGVSFSF
jgi:outer membrane protein OmpU